MDVGVRALGLSLSLWVGGMAAAKSTCDFSAFEYATLPNFRYPPSLTKYKQFLAASKGEDVMILESAQIEAFMGEISSPEQMAQASYMAEIKNLSQSMQKLGVTLWLLGAPTAREMSHDIFTDWDARIIYMSFENLPTLNLPLVSHEMRHIGDRIEGIRDFKDLNIAEPVDLFIIEKSAVQRELAVQKSLSPLDAQYNHFLNSGNIERFVYAESTAAEMALLNLGGQALQALKRTDVREALGRVQEITVNIDIGSKGFLPDLRAELKQESQLVQALYFLKRTRDKAHFIYNALRKHSPDGDYSRALKKRFPNVAAIAPVYRPQSLIGKEIKKKWPLRWDK